MVGPLAFLGALAFGAILIMGIIWFFENVEIKRKQKRKR